MKNLATQAARLMAICGGLVLTVLIVLICISVIGRSLNGLLHGWIGAVMPGVSAWALDLGVGPINGDFELVEAGVAFAIFAFLPLCQISAGHASVDIFTAKLPTRINRVLQLAIDVIFAVVLILSQSPISCTTACCQNNATATPPFYCNFRFGGPMPPACQDPFSLR